jgi:glycosyltransferase involved in cell wall biosynthesis
VIPNWVDVGKFEYKPHAAHCPVNLGILGQISPHKGHEDAVTALQKLGGGYRLLIAGKGEEAYVGFLKDRCRDLPVEFLGFVSLPEFFKMVDILLVPSWEEPFGIVLLEAMSTGVPVVATNVGGPVDIVRHETDGILVPPKDPSALASGVRSLADEDRRSLIIKQARERVQAEFDIRKVVPKVEEFYRRVLGSTK